ncbi:histone-lysine N-methyltransferase SETMAR [Trichonephila clavata]|uniref:Histone-lysine N-methyltransferase SETMAR n=1 Tax=Trichonephila clavata TaxID=2740835 RepID=A0A8X6KLU9_TRICU|nr:histone-lysine N-methyltransferase SETMAR [Trichonephila clavata]
MVIVTYDVRGVIVFHFVPQVRTMIAQYYRDLLERKVRRGVQDKRPDIVDSAIILHDNARPHKAECVRQLLGRWDCAPTGDPIHTWWGKC